MNYELIIRRTSFGLYALLCVIMAAATLVENSYGTEVAHLYIYDAWWFIALWVVTLLTTLPCVPKHFVAIGRLFKRLAGRIGSRRAKRGTTLVAVGFVLFGLNHNTAEAARVVERAQADSMRSQLVIYNGRICPFNTPARDFTLKLTGKSTYEGLTPEQVALSWALYPEDWKDVPMIKVKKAKARHLIGIEGNYARFADFFDPQGNYKLQPEQFPDIDDRLTLIVLLTHGEFFNPLPQGVPPISQQKVEAELLYNAVPWDTILFASAFTLGFLLFFLRLRKNLMHQAVTIGVLIAKCLLALTLLVSLGIRWYIADHIPLSNTYETLLVIALTALILACFTRHHDVPALIVAGATLLVAHIGALDPQVTPLVPILQSPWLSSHVTTIMISYCLFAMLLFRPNRTMLIWAELLLGTGIILGSIWAKTAWGSYWSWDPKETWALISLIIYMYPLHPKTLPWFRSEKHQRLYLRLAFLSILMTYFGCNYLLTGMHSYAN